MQMNLLSSIVNAVANEAVARASLATVLTNFFPKIMLPHNKRLMVKVLMFISLLV